MRPAAPTGWSLLPVVLLRQAGFAFDEMDVLADPGATTEAARIVAHAERLAESAYRLKQVLKREAPPRRDRLSTAIGMLRPLPAGAARATIGHLGEESAALVRAYHADAEELAELWQRWEAAHRSRLEQASAALIDAFRRQPRLRDVLLLSNDTQYPLLASWLDEPVDPSSARGRRFADLLCRYLQRVATKNETHAHFGPLTAGRVDLETKGVAWDTGAEQRMTFFSHWAAERLARTVSAAGELADRIQPRRRPWAFLRDSTVTSYAFTSEEGLAADWRFARTGQVRLTEPQEWLFRQCDGSRRIADLRASFAARYPRTAGGFDEVLASLTAQDLVVARFEVPIGAPEPLRELRRAIAAEPDAAAGPAVAQAHADIAALEQRLQDIGRADAAARPAAVSALKQEFHRQTGTEASRGAGLHYADRAVFFEECHGPVRDFRMGADLVSFVEEELAPVYQLALGAPRLRLARETAVLADWVAGRFGRDVDVPLDLFYAAYFADRQTLIDRCDEVDAAISRWDDELTAALLDGTDPGAGEVSLPRDRLEEVMARTPTSPPALCNPDIMLAAADADALRRGDFLAVIGDLHAVRELLTHSSVAVPLGEHAPELGDQVLAGYRRMLAPGELLCDLARSHSDKTATQLILPIPDVEIYGRSAKDRSQVISPDRMVVRATNHGIELRAVGVDARLRLLAPPAGGPSIRQDPLSPFAFPRRLGGLALHARGLSHVPRIRCGRIVLQREIWRAPAADLRGKDLTGAGRSGDAAEYLAAQRLRARLRLPRYVFAKVPHEPKPVFVDFDSPMLVRQLARMVRHTDGPVELSEMLPGPDGLWLERDDARYTTELRCALFSVPTEEVWS